jgi:hypothetical protein
VEACCSLFYLFAAVPGSLSMLYKERAIRDQPMDMVYLNAWVCVYQFIGGLMLAPFVFDVEVLHLDQKMSGLECLINGKSEVGSDRCQVCVCIPVGCGWALTDDVYLFTTCSLAC